MTIKKTIPSEQTGTKLIRSHILIYPDVVEKLDKWRKENKKLFSPYAATRTKAVQFLLDKILDLETKDEIRGTVHV